MIVQRRHSPKALADQWRFSAARRRPRRGWGACLPLTQAAVCARLPLKLKQKGGRFMKATRRRAGGVTLIEALLVLALLAILAALAAPALGQMVAQQRLQTTAAELAGALALTRSEAIKQGRRMVLCRIGPESAPHQRCATNSNTVNAPAHQWTAGWLLFADPNGNAQRDDGETLLRIGAAAPAGVLVRGNMPVARYVSYMPQGHTLLVTGAFQAGTLTLCRAGLSPSPAVQIVISRNGRPRQQRTTVASCV